jgi:hypothetical protein
LHTFRILSTSQKVIAPAERIHMTKPALIRFGPKAAVGVGKTALEVLKPAANESSVKNLFSSRFELGN